MNQTEDDIKRFETVKTLANMGHHVGCVTRFVLLFYSFMTINRDYGIDDTISMVELSMLITISDNSGISASLIAQKWKKTKGAISQTLKKLEGKGLIYKERDKKYSKLYGLYITQKGEDVLKKYYLEDTPESPLILNEMLKNFSAEEIRNFYCVMEKYSDILIDIM
ncbi:MAG: MarR family transcriptional regulator [Lachnospiraceae bacterium]|nr:MarR family transcriptional regulator [Lachnospiraceae bacterium]